MSFLCSCRVKSSFNQIVISFSSRVVQLDSICEDCGSLFFCLYVYSPRVISSMLSSCCLSQMFVLVCIWCVCVCVCTSLRPCFLVSCSLSGVLSMSVRVPCVSYMTPVQVSSAATSAFLFISINYIYFTPPCSLWSTCTTGFNFKNHRPRHYPA